MLLAFVRLSIRTRVLLSFAFFMSCVIGLGLFSMTRIAAVDEAAATISRDLLANQALGKVAASLEKLRAVSYYLLLAKDEAGQRDAANIVADTQKIMADGWAEYAATGIESREEQSNGDAVRSSWQQYETDIQKTLRIDQSGATGYC